MLPDTQLPRRTARRMAGVLAVGLLALSAQAQEKPAKDTQQKVLRVCQDPNNLPMSSKDEQGYENKIAALFAKKLDWKLEHTWYPQRMGYIRNTLTAKIPHTETYKCDVITGVSSEFDRGLATKPYLTSSYAIAFVKGKGLDSVKTPEDVLKLDKATLAKLKIGVFSATPAVDWLIKNQLTDQMVSYQLQTADPDQYPGQLIQHDLATGKLDMVIAWGPIAGYFATHADNNTNISVVPFKAKDDGIRYGFSIAMGVRYGNKPLRDKLNELIASNQPEINAILKDYGVPMITPVATATKPSSAS